MDQNILFETDLFSDFSQKEKELLHKLAVQDEDLFIKTAAKIFRLKNIIKTGNLAAWQKIKSEEKENIKTVLSELKEQPEI